jgi:hypothetical protein
VRLDVDIRRVMATAVKVLERHEVGGQVFDDLLEALDAGLAWPHGNGHGESPRS